MPLDDHQVPRKFGKGISEGRYVLTLRYQGPDGVVESTLDLNKAFTGQICERTVGEIAACMLRTMQEVTPEKQAHMQSIALS